MAEAMASYVGGGWKGHDILAKGKKIEEEKYLSHAAHTNQVRIACGTHTSYVRTPVLIKTVTQSDICELAWNVDKSKSRYSHIAMMNIDKLT